MKKHKTLYDIFKMEDEDLYHLVHAGDTYLSSSLDFEHFVNILKKDDILVNPTLPEWDTECQDMAEELFEHLDANNDEMIDNQDLIILIEKKKMKNALIYNKVRDFDEITFDMKVRLSGAMDFSLPKSEIEAIITGLTRTDLGRWSEEQESKKFSNKDEL